MIGFFSAGGLQYYNMGHFLMMLFVPAIFCGLYFSLRNKTQKLKYKALMLTFLINGVLFVSYKLFMFFTYDTFEILNELPLHLCNLNVILLPLALKTKNKFLFSYLFYVGTIGALAAVTLFDTLFLSRPIYDYGVFIYFFYHSVLLVSGVLFACFKFYTPSLKGIFMAMGTLLCLATLMHLINTILRATGACTVANYFYTYGMDGNPLLGMLMKLIPVPVLYMVPILPVLGIVNCLMFFPFYKRHQNEDEGAMPIADASETAEVKIHS